MKNQFSYTVKHNTGTEAEPVIIEAKASFNIDMVIRSMEMPDGGLVVILDDFHEEMVTGSDTVNTSTNKIIRGKRELTVVQSEIQIDAADKERFFNLLAI
jgi:hypothetical protein